MKVALLFFARDFLGGAERRLLRIYNGIASEENICDLIVFGCNMSLLQKILSKADCKTDNINCIRAFESKLQCLKYLAKDSSYGLIHFVDASSFNLMVAYLCKIRRKFSLYSICNYHIAKDAICNREKRINRKIIKTVSHVDLLYPSSLDFIKRIAGNKVSVTPGTFTNLELFCPTVKEKLILFAAARLEEAKNPMLLVKAVSIICDEIKNSRYKVKILGKGYEEDIIRNYILENNLSEVVELVGYVRTSDLIPKASVFLSLQKIENYPSQSLAEAIACGCYVIVTDVGDSRKCANAAFSDFIEDDPKALADALLMYINKSDKEKEEIVDRARKFALDNYSIDRSEEYFSHLISKAARKEENENEM